MNKKFKLKKGDEVIVLAGKDKGKTGKIVKINNKRMPINGFSLIETMFIISILE